LVVKPDQLIKRRGKLGLIKGNVDLQGARDFIQQNLGKEISVSNLEFSHLSSLSLSFSLC